MNTTCHIRWMIRRDMPEVLEIENKSSEFPWSEEDFIRYLRQRNCIGMVAEFEGQVVGFMIYELHNWPTKKLNILNFAVHQNHRRRGVGTHMINKLISKLCHRHRTRLTFCLRETNLIVLKFLKHYGFMAVTIEKSPYDDCDEDGIIMEYKLPQETNWLFESRFCMSKVI